MKEHFDAVYKIGVELEGGWEDEPDELRSDGSVSVNSAYVGEVSIGPYRQFINLAKGIRSDYPNNVNGSCGLHVHVSFRTLAYYEAILSLEFTNAFIEHMQFWGKDNLGNEGIEYSRFHARLGGDNQFCRRNTESDSLFALLIGRGERYRIWNFPFRQHGTAECRVLPMFDEPENAILAIGEVVSFVDDWALKHVDDPMPKCIVDDSSVDPMPLLDVMENIVCVLS